MNGRHLTLIIESVDRVLVLLQLEAICMHLVGRIYALATMAQPRDLTLWRMSGRESQICWKKEATLLVWPLKKKIFVAGGNGFRKRLETCEMYNTLTNEWQLVANLNVPRCYGSMVCLNGKLYVLGGKSGQSWHSRGLSVECFDPASDQWIHETTIPAENVEPRNNNSFIGSVLKLSRELLDKLTIVE